MDDLPEFVSKRIDSMLTLVPVMTPAELREHVTLLCAASYHAGAMVAAKELREALTQ
jgi:hypothetical protein